MGACRADRACRCVRANPRLAGRARATSSLRQMLEIGDKAPDFTLPDQDGNDVALAGLKGQTVVLYFYPKADTPGCTTQACGVRDHLPDYTAAGVRVRAGRSYLAKIFAVKTRRKG